MNLKFLISYDGSAYKGSQKQVEGLTVENELLKAFETINIKTKIILAGRTDSKVHATGQVFNCIVPNYWKDLGRLKELLNKLLYPSIKIRKISLVDELFHARFSAKKRVYRYLISTKETNPFNSKYLTYVKKLDEDLLKEAIKEFVGVYDFKYFYKTGSDTKNTIREIFATKFYKYKNGIYVFSFTANGYLRSQIRLMVGFLLAINDKKLTILDLKKQLKAEKHIFKNPAEANGLYLAKIKY